MSGEHLLKEYQGEDDEKSFPPMERSWAKQKASTLVLYLIVACLVASNVFLYRQNQRLSPSEDPGLSKYGICAVVVDLLTFESTHCI